MSLASGIIRGQVLPNFIMGEPLVVRHRQPFSGGKAPCPGFMGLGKATSQSLIDALEEPGARATKRKDTGIATEDTTTLLGRLEHVVTIRSTWHGIDVASH